MNKEKLLSTLESYLPEDRVGFVSEAYEFAELSHRGQVRRSGEPYIQHPLSTALHLTALHLTDLKLDANCIAAALLHDVIEDCDVTPEQLDERFGPEVTQLVDGVSKLTRLELMAIRSANGHTVDDSATQAENLRKMLVAMAQDIRVVLIKLADRLHNMSTLRALPRQRQLNIAQETLDIYAPLAHRLGIADLKWKLEDLAFRVLQPDRYREISRLLTQKRAKRERYVSQVTHLLKSALDDSGIEAEVTGRPKHIYSIHRKMARYAAQGKEFDQIHDLFALRVLVKKVVDCYATLGIAHSLWHPIPGQFDDYIANPRENSYQSLHTSVIAEGGVPMEIQIRTQEMHQVSEFGIAAHWRYKEGAKGTSHFEDRMTWVRQLLEWQREVSGAEEFMESVKTDLLPNQVFVYTPKGEVKELPAGATPIDFAYRIHTDIGHQCSGAKVNGKLTSLDYQLQNGDTVQVLTSSRIQGPRLDWLNPDIGYVQTAGARQAIRLWFRKQERVENIQRGQELIEKERRRLALGFTIDEIADKLSFTTKEDLYAAVGSGTISIHQITTRLTATEKPTPDVAEELASGSPTFDAGVTVLGVEDVLTRLAKCCQPLPGNEIMGFITRAQGVSIHRKSCHNITNVSEPERLIEVGWGSTARLYPVRIEIEGKDRVGLLRDITTVVSAEKVNISGVVTETHQDGMVTEHLSLGTNGISQLSRIFNRLEKVPGVLRVRRSDPGSKPVKAGA